MFFSSNGAARPGRFRMQGWGDDSTTTVAALAKTIIGLNDVELTDYVQKICQLLVLLPRMVRPPSVRKRWRLYLSWLLVCLDLFSCKFS
jgi:hypothetical protein